MKQYIMVGRYYLLKTKITNKESDNKGCTFVSWGGGVR